MMLNTIAQTASQAKEDDAVVKKAIAEIIAASPETLTDFKQNLAAEI